MTVKEKLETIAKQQQDVFDAGKAKERSDFWDFYQDHGNRRNYHQAFYSIGGKGWTDNTYHPKYPITGLDGTNSTIFVDTMITDIKVPVDLSSAVKSDLTFYTNPVLKKIPMLTLPQNPDATVTNIFHSCKALEDVTFGGTILHDISFAWSPNISDSTIESMTNALEDRNGKTALKVSFHSTTLARLTEAQISAIEAKNWTI